MFDKVKRWLRSHGLAPFGFAQENFHAHHLLLRVWGPLRPARWEVYRWPVGTGADDVRHEVLPLPWGSPEAWRRIQFCAEGVYSGRDWNEALRAFGGEYPDGTTDRTRPPVGGDIDTCPRCHQFDCTPECIAQEQAEVDGCDMPRPRKYA